MFKFEIGQRVKIIGDRVTQGNFGIIEERAMSSGVISIPRYYILDSWYYNDELEAV